MKHSTSGFVQVLHTAALIKQKKNLDFTSFQMHKEALRGLCVDAWKENEYVGVKTYFGTSE